MLALTALRLLVAAFMPLSPDESYYWVWSRALAGGFLDHPPMIALWIRAGCWLLGDGALGVRVLGPLSALAGSLLLLDAGERLFPGRQAGPIAVALLNASLIFGVGTVIVTPDTPLLFFWTAALWALSFVALGRPWFFALAGLFAGLALASKYTAVFFPLGALIWVLVVPSLRRLFRHPAPWLGAVLGIAVFSPVLAWNAEHGWASFLRQGGRTGDFTLARAPQFLSELVFGQMGLATPIIFVLCVAGVAVATRLAWRQRDVGAALCAALVLPGAALFVQHALGDRVQGNWPSILYPAAALTVGLLGASWRRWVAPGAALGFGLTALLYAHGLTFYPPIGMQYDPSFRLLAGWPRLAEQVAATARAEHADFIVADDYPIAAELARRLPPDIPVIGMEPRWALFDLPRPELTGHGILVRSTRRGDDIAMAPWSSLRLITTLSRGLYGMTAEGYRLYAVTPSAAASPIPAALMPRREEAPHAAPDP